MSSGNLPSLLRSLRPYRTENEMLLRCASTLLISVLLLTFPVTDGLAQSFVITELMAANATGERDEDGEFSDWIEIYNPDAQGASLQGWYLTDSPQDRGQWQFPNLTVPGGGTVLVFASGKDRRDPAGNLHTNFKLDRSGE